MKATYYRLSDTGVKDGSVHVVYPVWDRRLGETGDIEIDT
jgi:hypothetical protein